MSLCSGKAKIVGGISNHDHYVLHANPVLYPGVMGLPPDLIDRQQEDGGSTNHQYDTPNTYAHTVLR
jgi:hypothetical protein